ncbi:MAG TPA: M56 family metallopeptidase [Verrucomicrobiota bacterium]|nr:M56 family metallopeptidase [Verrucomicrobiota bacterium]HNT14924.1 M56 family metallopeptidase [Verrucomicrobiota bacterium]
MNLELYLTTLGRVSLQAGVLVVLVLAVQWLFRKQLPPRWRCALWLLVVVRLLLPFSPGSAASIFNLLPRWKPIAVAPATAPGSTVQSPLVSPPVARQDGAGPIVASPSLARPAVETAVTSQNQPTSAPRMETSSLPASPSQPAAQISWMRWLFWIWLSGVAALTGYVLICSLRLAWRCRRWRPNTDSGLRALLEECAARLEVRSRLEIIESAEVSSPALFGWFRPRLLLPENFAANFTPQELRFVFLHELAHLKRRDLPLNWLITLLQIGHWFNPLIWLGFARWRTDRELACDALALEAAGGDQSREYGRTILHLLEHFTHRATAPGLVGILEDKRQLRQRIRMIASFRPGKRWGGLALALIVGLAVIGLTDAQTAKPAKSTGGADGSGNKSPAAQEMTLRTGADPQPEPLKPGLGVRSLTVTVLDPDGKPLPGAEVYAPHLRRWDQPQVKGLTDTNGQFILRFPEAPESSRREMSNFGVSASHPNFTQRAMMWTSSAGDVHAGLPEAVTIKLERGTSIGGTVRDQRGAPLAGIRVLLFGSTYRGFTLGNTERLAHEYSELSERDPQSPAATTDASGHWSFDRFPSDLQKVEVTFVRPDDSREVFSTDADDPLNRRPVVALAELQAGMAVTQLRDGVTVRGLVVDETGQPLSGVTINEGYGHGNIVRVGQFTNDAAGKFERPHRAPRQWIYTASRADRATTSVVAQVAPGMAEVRIVLPPAKPWTARVTDESGQPLRDVEFHIDLYRTPAQILDWTGKTDEAGRIVWSNAPLQTVTAYASSLSLGANLKIKLAGGQPEQTIVLSKTAAQKIRVHVRAVDAGTRAPVKIQSVAVRLAGAAPPFKPLATPERGEFTGEIQRSDFQVGMYPSYQLKIEADGYESLITESIDFDFGHQDLELALHRTTGTRELTVFQPDGQPAAGARLWTRAAPDDGSLFINAPNRYYGDRLEKEQADAEGNLTLPSVPADAPVVIAYTNGFLESPMSDLRRSGRAQLAAYGVVEGRLLVAGKPRHGVNIMLTTLAWSREIGYHLSYNTTSDAEGRFRFMQVPPGTFKLYRWVQPKHRDTSGMPITETYQMPIVVAAGQTNRVEYYTPGRVVTGQAVPAPADVAVDWFRDIHTLSLRLPMAATRGRVNREDYATLEAFAKANRASYQAQQQADTARRARTYGLTFESDGSFRVEDVPPGTYELRLRVTKPDDKNRRHQFGDEPELGSLVREVVVPEGDGPLDLGTLAVAFKDAAPVRSSPPVSFRAVTLDGQPFTLEKVKGRHVLLVFWAAWSERSREFFATLQKLPPQYASDPRLVIVGASLDDHRDTARQIATAEHFKGTQTWLDAESRAKFSAEFDLTTLPAVFLLDPEGRMAARDLEGERLATTLHRALARK